MTNEELDALEVKYADVSEARIINRTAQNRGETDPNALSRAGDVFERKPGTSVTLVGAQMDVFVLINEVRRLIQLMQLENRIRDEAGRISSEMYENEVGKWKVKFESARDLLSEQLMANKN